MTLNSPEVFELDTDFLPDVLGLRTWHPDAAPVLVLLGRTKGSVRVLVPDKK